MTKQITITQMKRNETGKVIMLHCGGGMAMKLENMGIRPGIKIKKVSQQLMGGPVVVKAGNLQVGIGFGMAKKIIVEVMRNS